MGIWDTLVKSVQNYLPKNLDNLRFSYVKTKHIRMITGFLKEADALDEPFCNCVKSCLNHKRCLVTEYHIYKTLQDNLSVMAQDEEDKVVAVSLSGLLGPNDIQNDRQYLARIRQPNTKYLLTVLSDHTQSSDIFENLRTDKLCEMRLLAVDHTYKFDRVASKLLELTEQLAQENNISFVKADFVNKRMKRLLKARNYKIMRDTVYVPKESAGHKPHSGPLNLSLFYKTLENEPH